MLSDHERETLRRIQRELVVDDPDLEQSFRAFEETAPTQPPPPRGRWAYTAGIVVAATLAVVLLLAGLPGGALAFAVIAGSVAFARHLDQTTRQRKLDD